LRVIFSLQFHAHLYDKIEFSGDPLDAIADAGRSLRRGR
jgi:hypothetical protein